MVMTNQNSSSSAGSAHFDKDAGSVVNDQDDHLRKRASIPVSCINLVNNTVGAGLFSLPWCLKESTLSTGLALMTLMCILNGISFILLAWCCELAQTCSYLKMMKKAFGHLGGTVAQICVLCYGIGSCISFVVLTGDFLVAKETGIFHAWAPDVKILQSRPLVVTVIAVTIFFPLSLLRNLEPLKYTSFVSLAATIYAGALCVWGFANDSAAVAADSRSGETPLEAPADMPVNLVHSVNYYGFPIGVFAAVPLVNVAYTCHYNAPRYYSELERRCIRRWEYVVGTVLSFVLAVYATTGVTGYLTFGDKTDGDILKNFAADWYPAVVARLALALLVIFTFPMTCHFIRDSIIDLYYKGEYTTLTLPVKPYVGITVAIIIVSCAVGATVTQVEDVLAYKGAIFGSCMVYIFPPLMYCLLKSRIESGEIDGPKLDPVWGIDDFGNRRQTGETAGLLTPSMCGGKTPVMTQVWWAVKQPRYGLLTLLVVWGIVTGILGVVVTVLKQSHVLDSD